MLTPRGSVYLNRIASFFSDERFTKWRRDGNFIRGSIRFKSSDQIDDKLIVEFRIDQSHLRSKVGTGLARRAFYDLCAQHRVLQFCNACVQALLIQLCFMISGVFP